MRVVGFIVSLLVLVGLICGLWWLRLHTAQATPTTITIENLNYSPSNIEIKKGTTVKFVNKDNILHTVTSDKGLFNSGNLNNGQEFQYTFDQTGTFYYHCNIHPTMKGQITVK